MSVHARNARALANQGQLANRLINERARLLAPERGDDILRHQGSLTDSILGGRRIGSFPARARHFGAVAQRPHARVARHGAAAIDRKAAVLAPR